MSDKIEREIEEILSRLDEPEPEEDTPDRARGLSHVSRLTHIPRRQIMLASLVLAVLVAAGLFFGLAYPSLSSSGSADEEILHESAGDQIGEGIHVDEASPESSVDEGTDTDERESERGVGRPSEDHEEHGRDGGEQH
jgi:hypothetical protein